MIARFFSRLWWCLLQLLPLTYRTYYGDEEGCVHFCVWRMWFGRCFAVDDVVVDPYETLDNDSVRDVCELMDAMDEADDALDDMLVDLCDGDCENCPLGY